MTSWGPVRKQDREFWRMIEFSLTNECGTIFAFAGVCQFSGRILSQNGNFECHLCDSARLNGKIVAVTVFMTPVSGSVTMINLVLETIQGRTLAVFGLPGGAELIIVLVIIVVLFGNRLPGTMRSLGQSLVQFKKGMREDDHDNSNDKLP
jgi:sec-independent protein translocase protein TatA